jgi:hypothetical protein
LAPPESAPLPIESTLVLLSGREELWRAWGAYATSPRMVQVVERRRAEASPREFDELAVAPTVLVNADRRKRPGLRQTIVATFGPGATRNLHS